MPCRSKVCAHLSGSGQSVTKVVDAVQGRNRERVCDIEFAVVAKHDQLIGNFDHDFSNAHGKKITVDQTRREQDAGR